MEPSYQLLLENTALPSCENTALPSWPALTTRSTALLKSKSYPAEDNTTYYNDDTTSSDDNTTISSTARGDPIRATGSRMVNMIYNGPARRPRVRRRGDPRIRATGSRMVNMIYNGPARRPRVRTTPTQREILQQARFDQNIRDGQRLGAIPEAPTPLARPTNPTNDDITNPPDGANH
ncbi:hypothetical protein PtA15_6A522 [Puccinia triticina]|uniref:Uncharacterized protein n=1 Tax=Puccinia triticina TaxID=208348 RepID=A0ABY7CLT3_9BASI|nr:uncharacterized protein PtA15_6A522 [Puccinia triticina]WAQ85893.1 hypothetical protein PtA15_6A522 [Puccinia triticina]